MRQRTTAIAVRECRLCSARRLTRVLSLGNQFVSDFVTPAGEHPKSPLELVRCQHCGLIQLKHTFPRTNLYRHYWYRSGISKTMRDALADVAAEANRVAKPAAGEIVMDTDCNDGTLLRSYTKNVLSMDGFEIYEKLVDDARKDTERII